MESENNWKEYLDGIETGEEGKGEIWSRRFKIGILSVYIDDMSTPYLSTMVNIGEVINMENFYSSNTECAGCAYFTFTGSTSFHDPGDGREATPSSVNSNAEDFLLVEPEVRWDGRDRDFDALDEAM